MSFIRAINKTPLFNENSNVYEINEINSNMLNHLIQSRFIGEGVYTLEQLSLPEYNERYVISPSFDKLPLTSLEKEWKFNYKEVEVYQLELKKQFFMPLDTDQFVNIFETISNLRHVTVFTQVLICKRQDNWREVAISAYESFLDGNDSPIDNKYIRNIQDKALKMLNRISNYSIKRNSIEEMEQKILQNGYRFECRFIAFENKYCNYFEKEMEKELSKLRLFNELELVKVNNKKSLIKLIENREFQSELVNQLLSESELFSILCESSPKQLLSSSILEKPIKQQSITKALEERSVIQNAIKLLPRKENNERQVDEIKAKQVNQALKRVGIVKNSLKVNEIHQGSSLQKIQLVVPPEITYTSIQKKLVDIQGALGNENISIEIGDKPDTINVYVPLENRDVIYFRQILESDEFNEFRANHLLPFIVGENVNGGHIFGCLTKLRHLLIAGTTGSGKSVFVNLILICLILCVSPEDILLYLIDPKMVEFTQFNGFPQVKEVITDMKKAGGLLYSLCEEMDSRYDQFSKVKVRDIQGYNQMSIDKMPYIVVAIDELADLMMVNGEVEEHIVRLGQKARAAGIHLILTTQRPSVDVVTGLIKANMPNRIAFSVTSQVDSRTILDKGGAEKLLGMGDGIVKIEGNKREFERFQSPVLTLDSNEEIEIFEKLKELFKNVEINHEEINIQEKEEPIDQIKRIIANTGETRISELQKLLGIRINVVSDLVKELVEEGWLEKQGRSYEVIINEDELSKWRSDG